jgi:ribosome assembly protein 4
MALTGHKGNVSCVKWGGAGWIYSASHDRTVKVWDATKGTLVHTLTSHAHWVNHLALSTDFVLRTGYYDHKGRKEAPETVETKRKKAQERYDAVIAGAGGIERLVSGPWTSRPFSARMISGDATIVVDVPTTLLDCLSCGNSC